MKTLLTAAVLLAGCACTAAQATEFDFSYTFADNTLLAGTLEGDLNGAFLENVTNIHVILSGNEFTGAPLFAAAWNPATQDWDNTIPAKISTDASLNNFLLADTNFPTDPGASNYFYFVNDPSSLGQQVFATNLNTQDIAFDSPANGSWSLVPAAVPLPAALPLFLSGLGLFGAAARRRAPSV